MLARIILLLTLILPSFATAENLNSLNVRQLNEKIEQLQKELDELKNKPHDLKPHASTEAANLPNVKADMAAMEETIKKLNSHIEELEKSVHNLSEGAAGVPGVLKRPDDNPEHAKSLVPESFEDIVLTKPQPKEDQPAVVAEPAKETGPGSEPQAAPTLPAKPAEGKANDETAGPIGELIKDTKQKIKNRNFAEAEANIKKLLAANESDVKEQGQILYGDLLMAENKAEEAYVHFIEVYNNYPKTKRTPLTLVKLAQSLEKAGKLREACATFVKLKNEFNPLDEYIAEMVWAEEKKLNCAG